VLSGKAFDSHGGSLECAHIRSGWPPSSLASPQLTGTWCSHAPRAGQRCLTHIGVHHRTIPSRCTPTRVAGKIALLSVFKRAAPGLARDREASRAIRKKNAHFA
jgi:hypothetical protein